MTYSSANGSRRGARTPQKRRWTGGSTPGGSVPGSNLRLDIDFYQVGETVDKLTIEQACRSCCNHQIHTENGE